MERTHRQLLTVVAVLIVATAAGISALWPRAASLPEVEAAPDAVVGGIVRGVELFEGEPDPVMGGSRQRARITVDVLDGPDAGRTVVIETSTDGYPRFDIGDEVQLSQVQAGESSQYVISDFQRLPALGWLALVFIAAVLLIGRWHGLRSLVGLALSLLVVVKFIVPAIIAGESPALVALVGAVAVMLVTLYVSHGVSEMTTAAVVGTTIALAITIGAGLVFIEWAELTGFSSEEAMFARAAVGTLDVRGLVLAGLIIGALGVLDDVTVSQASTVFALHDTDPALHARELFTRAMRVGRDHIASTVNTLFLAYAGASLALLVVFSTGGLPLGEILNSEILAQEVVATIVGSLGLIAAVPTTTALAAVVASRRGSQRPTRPLAPGHVGEELDDEERAARAWARYLHEHGQDAPPDD